MEREYEHRLTEVEERSKSNTHRLDEVEKRQESLDKLTTSVSLLADREQRVERDVKEIKADVKTLAEKPGKRYDALVEKVIWAVLAAALGLLLGKAGIPL